MLSRSSGNRRNSGDGLDVDLVELVEENEALLVSAANEDVEVVQRRLPIDTPFCMATSLLMISSYCG